MTSLARVVYSLVVACVSLIGFSQVAMAQGVQDFVITNFSANYALSNQDPQGLLEVTETIDLDYSGQNRGILRAIPNIYNDTELDVNVQSIVRDGAPEPYITYAENDNTIIRIGDSNVVITGEHRYEITYTVRNVITFYDDYDEFFWDVNGDGWQQPFNTVSVELSSSAPLDSSRPAQCFTGSFGSTAQNCTISEGSSRLDASTTQPLEARETLTILQAYQKGYFTPPSWWEQHWQLVATAPFLLGMLLVIWSSHTIWRKFGKDIHAKGLVAPYFGRPKEVSVLQASYVAENRLTPKHLSATIIDLAIRGYLQIVETGSGKKVKHQLTIIKSPDKQVTALEKKLLQELFGSSSVGSSIHIEDKKQKLHTVLNVLAKDLDSLTTDKGFYEVSPKKAGRKQAGPIGLAILFVIIGFVAIPVLENPIIIIGAIVTMAVVVLYAALMPKRSQSGERLKSHMQGLKLYLGYSEKDRLAAHDAVEAPLAANAKQPERTVSFFEKLLPFAIAMGVEKSWAKSFEDMYQQPPDWYQGRWNTFTTAALLSSLNSTVSATSQSFSAPSSSGSSGFSGGGFSGGGGGGGGGGGW